MVNLASLIFAGLVVWLLWRTRPAAQISICLRALELRRQIEIESKLRLEGRGEKSEETKRDEFKIAKNLAAHYPFDLAVLYAAGWGVEKNQDEALRWYREAAERGDRRAQYNLAAAYFEGDGVSVDYGAAYFWLKVREMGSGVQAVGDFLTLEERLEIENRARKWFGEHSEVQVPRGHGTFPAQH